MSANTETTGAPPKGYVECPKKCGRWTNVAGECWTCRGKAEWNAYSSCPDWTPPIAAPAAHVERRKGQRWKHVNSFGDVTEWALDAYRQGKDSGWDATDSGGAQGYVMDACWGHATITMTLLADAPPEPAKCESWCGNDLPPEGRPGWGFLLDVDANVAERFKLGRSGFVKRDLAIGWCTDECRESYISKTGFREMKSPPAHEAPKAAPVCGNNGCKTPHQNVAQRWCASTDGYPAELEWSCEPCHLLDEKDFTMPTKHAPYAGPERLPKPQLAADWVEDCLGDVR